MTLSRRDLPAMGTAPCQTCPHYATDMLLEQAGVLLPSWGNMVAETWA